MAKFVCKCGELKHKPWENNKPFYNSRQETRGRVKEADNESYRD
jgi:hypothetical protein